MVSKLSYLFYGSCAAKKDAVFHAQKILYSCPKDTVFMAV